MKTKTNQKTRAIAFCSMLAALAVVFLCIGMLFPTLDMTAAVVASCSVIFAVCELGKGYAIGVFAASAFLGIIISPQNSAAWFYAGFMGYYPILKSFLELKLRNKILIFIIKFLAFNAAFATAVFVLIKFFAFEKFIGWYAVGLVAIAEFVFVLYDMLLNKMIISYYRILRPRLKIKKFLKK